MRSVRVAPFFFFFLLSKHDTKIKKWSRYYGNNNYNNCDDDDYKSDGSERIREEIKGATYKEEVKENSRIGRRQDLFWKKLNHGKQYCSVSASSRTKYSRFDARVSA